jgi:hypothetical protein
MGIDKGVLGLDNHEIDATGLKDFLAPEVLPEPE